MQTLRVPFEAEFETSLKAAVTPSEADLTVARELCVRALMDAAGDPQRVRDFEDAWLTAHDATRTEATVYQAADSTDPGRRMANADPTDPVLMTVRAKHAIRFAVAELTAEGVLTRGHGDSYRVHTERVPVNHQGRADGVEFVVHSPLVDTDGATRYQLVRPQVLADGLLPTERMLEGLDRLLGPRGTALLRESRGALRRGLYLAAASLLATASEAAWFNLARAVALPQTKLASLAEDGEDIGKVIELTAQRLSELKVRQGLLNEVRAEGNRLRDIRNYALHPVDEDQHLDAWLTESGATVLTVAARSYFVKLAGLLVAHEPGRTSGPETGSRLPASVSDPLPSAESGLTPPDSQGP